MTQPCHLLKITRRRIAPPIFRALFLLINSAIQSTFGKSKQPTFRQRQATVLAAYAAIIFASIALNLMTSKVGTGSPVLLGLTFPGAGFLHWISNGQAVVASSLFAVGFVAFAFSLIVWFATGNVLAPIMTWIGLSFFASLPDVVGLMPNPAHNTLPWLIGPATLLAGSLLWLRAAPVTVSNQRRSRRIVGPDARNVAALEMPVSDNARARLLLDRALQPINQFEGFEWRDQFQTAAVRYQVNFVAYALAITQHHHAPAATSYFKEAQSRLLGKIADHRLWRYWQLENVWGNLRIDRDPVPHQNIMYSGFTLLQMALGDGANLDLAKAGKPWRSYSMDDVAEALKQQYLTSPYGLLACEPNWIYPLCNLITMAGIKASDARLGTARWQGLAEPFLASLEREATRSDGSFIAFRSSLTGFAPPAPGGIVMQALPCLFLNALAPDQAQEHWHRVRQRLDGGSWKRLFWPIDTGNYGFSRASGYAATAAAAVEMGDRDVADECFRRLEIECPTQHLDEVAHRSNASLWAHALEVFARSNRCNGLRELVNHAPRQPRPHLVSAPYPDVQILHAVSCRQALELVLVPGCGAREVAIEIGGLLPGRQYTTGLSARRFVTADDWGTVRLSLPLAERTYLFVRSAF